MVRAAWLTGTPWWNSPYYRCSGTGSIFVAAFDGHEIRGYEHDPDIACCWTAAWKDWIEATKGKP